MTYIVKGSLIQGELHIPMKKLSGKTGFRRELIVCCEEGEILLGKNSRFKTKDFSQTAVFSTFNINNGLTLYQRKLVNLFHEEWLNALWDHLNESIETTLREMHKRRQNSLVIPDKSSIFIPFLTPISETVVPDYLTSTNGNPDVVLWKEFLDLCKTIQNLDDVTFQKNPLLAGN